MDFEARFSETRARSADLFARASELLPGGVGSSARSVRAGWSPYPPSIANGTGSHVTDVDGNDYVDYLMGLGPMLFGHRPPEITAAVVDAVQKIGTVFGLPYELEAVAAQKVCDAVPSVEMIRFASSGSEAVGTAVRLARALTGRKYILRFEGMYHGWMDTVYWSNHPDPGIAGPADRPATVPAGRGMLPEVGESLIVLSWNDFDAVKQVMAERGDEIAAIITEPVMLNTGCILPDPGYLELLRQQATEHGSLLIFDEVITGFRFARGGAQEFYGILPDITTMAKGLGGGFPVAAIGGTREVMEAIADGRYSHSGTYNSNVIQMAAVSATMDLLTPERYAAARALGGELMDGLQRLASGVGIPARVVGLGTVFQIWFAEEPIRNWRDAARYANEERFTRWWQEMVSRGVLFHPAPFENLFVSFAHTREDVDRTLQAAEQAMGAL